MRLVPLASFPMHADFQGNNNSRELIFHTQMNDRQGNCVALEGR